MPSPRAPFSAVILPLLFSLVAGCGGDSTTAVVTPEDATFASSLGVDISQMTKLESGVFIQTLTTGEGAVLVTGNGSLMDYTLWLPNATVLDAATGWSYTHDVTDVTPGFRDGVHRMLIGEERLIVIPSDQGYGTNPPPGLPVNSILVYRVTLTAISQ